MSGPHLGDDFDFDACVTRQPRHLHRRARRRRSGKVLRVDFIHRGKFVHVGEVNRRLDHVAQVEFLRGKQCLDVGDDLLGLLSDRAVDEFSGIADERNLAGKKNKGAGIDPLGIRPNCGGARQRKRPWCGCSWLRNRGTISLPRTTPSGSTRGSIRSISRDRRPKSSSSVTSLWSFGKLSLSGSWSGCASISE